MSAIQHPTIQTIAAFASRHGVAPADPLKVPLDVARDAALTYQAIWNSPLPPIARVATATIASPQGAPIPLRIFYPDDAKAPLPVLVYFHGGGFALNGLATHERLMRLLAQRSGGAVVGVGYSLAPERRFPYQLDEALAAIAWVRASGAEFGLDGASLSVGGDSAGANLALSATLALRDRQEQLPDLGLLFYGMFSANLDTPSHQKFGNGRFGLSTERVDWFWSQYLATPALRDDPFAAPLHADLRGLPPQIIVGAGLDCLLDDSLELARRLRAVGGEARVSLYPGMPHSFMQMSALLPAADQAITLAAKALSQKATGEAAA